MVNNLVVIGLGGIGSHLMFPLLQWLNQEPRFKTIVFVDGDKYEDRNRARQFFQHVGKNKALSTTMMYESMFTLLNFETDPRFINKENISEIIDEDDVILMCVDNNNTRKIVEDYCDTLQNFCLISGGNELRDGNVQIVQKCDGEYETPKLTESHPEIADSEDKHPDDLSCEQLSRSGSPQISIVNATIADAMRRTLYAMLEGSIRYHEIYVNCLSGATRNVKFDEELKSLALR